MYHSFHSLQNVLAGLGASVNALQVQQAQVLRELKDTESSVASFIGSQQQQTPLLPPQLSEDGIRKIVCGEVERAVLVSEDATRGWLNEQIATILTKVDRKIAVAIIAAPTEAPAAPTEAPAPPADQQAGSTDPTGCDVIHDVVADVDDTPIPVAETNIKGRKGGGGRGRGKKLTI